MSLTVFPSSPPGGVWGAISGTIGDQTDLIAALAAKASLSGAAFTGVSTLTLALTTTPTAGFSLINSAAATAANQKVSPSLLLRGSGWKTDATAASQFVDFQQNILPVQGAAAPTAVWQLQYAVNGGSFANVFA